MDCSVCTTMPLILRPPRNTICGACYEGARSILNMMNHQHHLDHQSDHKPIDNPPVSPTRNSSKYSFGEFRRWCGEQRSILNKQKDELAFLRTFVDAFRAQIHPDILVIPGKHNNGPPIAAHKALLATRSEIFKNMLESDECIKAEANKSITIPEMGREEVECLLEFLYDGKLSPEKLEKHVYALSLAADKYDIAYLGKVCEKYMVTSLSIGNALDVLEIADTCHNAELKESTMKFLVHNIGDVVLSDRYEEFVHRSPHLTVQLTRESVMVKAGSGSSSNCT